ncbi:hypothetical protein ACFX13_033864 [Malus domestica]
MNCLRSRKLDKLKWKVEGHRRSPRLSALEACKADQLPRLVGATGPTAIVNAGSRICTQQRLKSQVGKDKGPAFWTRDRKKRKLRPVDEVAATAPSSPLDQESCFLFSVSLCDTIGRVENGDGGHQTSTDQQVVQDKDSLKPGVHAASTDQPSTESAKWLPEKRILELILDKLQRKDTYEIFAEPVDPNEVEGYYEIIEEPMDFGTMRAKLHEGMYKNLEQFEHDAFLITENAMHFNSTATIYFRQARAIHELAKKVFHVLKTSPNNFELEFSETRQRSGRKAQGEAGRRSQVKIGCSSYIDAREHRVLSGTHDGRRSRSFEGDPRSTYRPWTSFLDEDESTSLTVISKLKQLEHVTHQDIGYTESLMLYVKDLGPTAQKIARKKLLGCSEMHKSQAPLASTSSQLAPSPLSNVFTSPPSHNFQDKLNEHPSTTKITGKKGSLGDEMGIQGPTVGGKVQCNEIHPNSSSLKSHHAGLADNSCSVSGFKNTGSNSTPMILNQWKSVNQAQPLKQPSDYSSQSNFLDPRLRNNMGFASFSKTKNKLSSLHLRGDDDQTNSEATQASKPDQGRPMLAQQFTFDLPYLRAQLGRINSSGQDRLSLQKGSGAELMVFPAEIKLSERDEKSAALW